MPEDPECAIVWFRRDLRLSDHAALAEAADRAETLVPTFADRRGEDDWGPGPAKQWWRARSVAALGERLTEAGLDLVVRLESPVRALRDVAEEVGADAVYFNENLVPDGLDRRVKRTFEETAIDVRGFDGRIIHDPSAVRTTSGGPYHVFTPFWNKFRDVVDVDEPESEPALGPDLAPEEWPQSAAPSDLGPGNGALEAPLGEYWTPGEEAARQRLDRFADEILGDYPEGRDRPDVDGTSRLSPRLHFGEISPRSAWHRIADSEAAERHPDAAESFLRELVWREFSYHLLVHYPETVEEPLRDKYADFPWASDPNRLERWKRGETGYPLVDAGMRQLLETGWMHNRVRMVVASFLTKDLIIPWQEGAKWFWRRLVDADLANNTMGWQWAAGSGADAQPFFRIFNPVSQSERHDPEGAYIRTWVPELADLPDDALHAPWDADRETLEAAGLELGADYPEPIVDHGEARERALAAWERIK